MGPLTGLKVVEFAGLGPGPFCAMVLADLGADVISIERPLPKPPSARQRAGDVLSRGRRSLVLDLKQAAAIEVALRLIDKAHVVIEGFRPGVMEKLGLGPEACLARNPALVYGRMTGWGQQGPLAAAAGHDINYIALSGALSMIGPPGGKPTPPPGLVGDFPHLPNNGTNHNGRIAASGWLPCLPLAREMPGASCWKAPTPVSLRC